jgi:translocator protein
MDTESGEGIMKEKNSMLLIVMNIIAAVATIVFNGLSQALPIGLETTATIANRVPIIFFPANLTFSIWGVIYIGWIAFAIYQALPAQRSNPFVRAVGWWFVLGSVGNMGWLLLFQNLQFAISTVPIVWLLVTLGIIYVNIRRVNVKPTTADIWAIFVPFSVYFAWAAVANVANATYVLFPGVGELWLGLSQETWGALMLVVAGAITGAVAYINRDLPYFLVIVWAFVGIILRYPDIQLVVVTAAAVAALGLLVVFARTFFGRRMVRAAA